MDYPIQFQKLTASFKKLPGVGTKSAERMAFCILSMSENDINFFIDALECSKQISKCPNCGNLSFNNEPCEICKCKERDNETICVVCNIKDVFSIEKTSEYKGLYHVLNGYISPSKNIDPDFTNINKLIERIKENKIKEVILATDLTTDGEITSMYLAKVIKKSSDVKVSRLAHGLPMGAMLDYADEVTLSKAFFNRIDID